MGWKYSRSSCAIGDRHPLKLVIWSVEFSLLKKSDSSCDIASALMKMERGQLKFIQQKAMDRITKTKFRKLSFLRMQKQTQDFDQCSCELLCFRLSSCRWHWDLFLMVTVKIYVHFYQLFFIFEIESHIFSGYEWKINDKSFLVSPIRLGNCWNWM